MARITALLVLGAILIAGCDAPTPGQRETGGAPRLGRQAHSATSPAHEQADAPAAPAGDDEERPWSGVTPGFPLVTIGTILESFLPR